MPPAVWWDTPGPPPPQPAQAPRSPTHPDAPPAARRPRNRPPPSRHASMTPAGAMPGPSEPSRRKSAEPNARPGATEGLRGPPRGRPTVRQGLAGPSPSRVPFLGGFPAPCMPRGSKNHGACIGAPAPALRVLRTLSGLRRGAASIGVHPHPRRSRGKPLDPQPGNLPKDACQHALVADALQPRHRAQDCASLASLRPRPRNAVPHHSGDRRMGRRVWGSCGSARTQGGPAGSPL